MAKLGSSIIYGDLTITSNTTVNNDLTVDGGIYEQGDRIATQTWVNSNFNDYSHPSHPGDDFSVDSGSLGGATVISKIDINVNTDTEGHVTDANGSISTRNLNHNDLNSINGSGNGYHLSSTQYSNYNDSNWDTAYDRSVTGVSGSGNGTLTVNREGVSDVTTDLSHSHSSGDLPSDIVYDSDIGTAAERDYTISTSDPSGGSDGDVWYKVE